ncbi:MAG: hypothetical protein ACXWLM_12175 [Myxococcales bacterium]
MGPLLGIALLAAAPSSGQAAPAAEEATPPWSLDLTVHDVGIGIGNSRHIDGIRLNFRDVAPYTVHGLNATIWMPAKDSGGGSVDGIALGLPLTGAKRIRGLALGVGVGAESEIDGIGVGVLGLGSGGAMRGIFVGGLGMGGGGNIDGIALGGLGIGSGGSARGILVGGLGAGLGGDLTGLAVGGLGVGAGGNVRGVILGGLGAGVGGNLDGIAAGLLGVGAGGTIRGITVAGLGIGSGGGIEGIAVAGLGVGSPRIRGVVAALCAGGQDVAGVMLAPAYFYIPEDGTLRGVSVSAFNRILGEQRGLVIGIVNYAASLHGVQLGLLNWAGNNSTGLKLLPIANAHFD